MNTLVISAHEDGAIEQAVEQLIAGNLVAVPTETVYGLAADASNNAAVQQIYSTKGRPSNNPLICHVSGKEMAARYVAVNAVAEKLMDAFWPGPLTLVMKCSINNGIAEKVSAGLDTLAVRCPANDATLNTIHKLNRPIAAPSANPSGKLSPTCAADVLEGLGGKIPLILDGGPTGVGIESTIIGVEDQRLTLLRPGTVTVDEVADIAGLPVLDRDKTTISAPGQLASHYAPDSPVRLAMETVEKNHFLIGFKDIDGDLNLSPSGDMEEAARNLFRYLRLADQSDAEAIAVAPVPMEGIGIAINDRLKRAAAPRDM